MFETRRVVLQGSIVSAALLLAGSGCTGDSGAKGDKGDPGAQGSAGPQGPQGSAGSAPTTSDPAAAFATATPIKHVVIIFGENVSFDHYFATYPTALNLAKETPFVAAAGTPKANNLATPLDVNNNFMPLGTNLLTNNPNKQNAQNTADGSTAVDPPRLTPKQASTADQNHAYGAEQASVNAGNGGLMDLFPSMVGVANPAALTPQVGKWLVMGYYDGNTVTALWNYAQRFAMSDNSWTTQFGPSSPGAINLISGQTNGATNVIAPNPATVGNTVADDGHGGFTVIGDPQPNGDVCSDPATRVQVSMTGKNIGDLLNEKNITWGSFMGGFDLTIVNPNGSFGCSRITSPTQQPFAGSASVDYIPHHAWFQYYASTANLMHLRPSSLSAIGSSKAADGSAEPANHNYDSHDFFDALAIGNLPAVSFVKAPAYQDGHGGYSNPIDEQSFIISVVNSLQKSPFWGTTAVIVAYDDSDGWYDHQAPPIVSQSSITPTATVQGDILNGPGACTGAGAQQGKTAATLMGAAGTTAMNGRCGYGTRVPLLVISPFARKNFIDHTLTDQTSVLKFIEDNWLAGKRIQPNGSFDTIAGPIDGMFDFSHPMPVIAPNTLWLDPSSGLEVDAAQIEATGLEK